jgi:hypothetical protein
MEEDAGTVAHVYFDGAQLIDTKGNAWTQNGTVPQNQPTPLYPDGFAGAQRKGAGIYSTANYYQLGSGSDVLDFAGGFTVCVAFVPGPAGSAETLVADGAYNFAGYYVTMQPAGSVALVTSDGPSSNTVSTSGAVAVLGGVNVACAGRAGTTQYVKLNLGTTASAAGAKTATAPTAPARIGRRSDGNDNPFLGTIIEVWATSTPWDEANVVAIQKRFFGFGQLTFTRTTAGTYTVPDGRVWTAPAGIPRFGCEDGAALTKCGLLVEGGKTNLALRSEELGTAPWSGGGITVSANAAVAPDGAITADLLAKANTSTSQALGQAITLSNGAEYSLSFWTKAGTATQLDFGVNCSGWPSSTVSRIVSGSGTTSLTTYGRVTGLTSGWTRIAYKFVSPGTSCNIYLYPDTSASSTSGASVYVWGVQLETGLNGVASNYIPTTSATVLRQADTPSVPSVLSSAGFRDWCVEGVFAPAMMQGWSVTSRYPWRAGGIGAANSAHIYNAGTSLYVMTYDSGAVYRARMLNIAGWADGSVRRIALGVSAGSIQMMVDGVSVGSLQGSGTAVLASFPATIDFVNGSTSISGYIRSFKISNAACK